MDLAQSKQNDEILKRVESHLSKELKVRVVNPEQMRGNAPPSGANGLPTPTGGAPGYTG
jgi:hypothetical protein